MSIVCVGAAPAPAFASPPAAVKIDNPRALGILHIGRMEDGAGDGMGCHWRNYALPSGCVCFLFRSWKLISAMIDCAAARNVGNILERFKVARSSGMMVLAGGDRKQR